MIVKFLHEFKCWLYSGEFSISVLRGVGSGSTVHLFDAKKTPRTKNSCGHSCRFSMSSDFFKFIRCLFDQGLTSLR